MLGSLHLNRIIPENPKENFTNCASESLVSLSSG